LQYRPTVENFKTRDHDIDGTTYSVNILEVGSAAEKPSPSCFEESAVLIIVYNTILRETFEHAKKLLNSLKATSGHALIVLIGNKDQYEVWHIELGRVSTTEGCRLAEDYRALFWEISAINTKNVQNFFTSLLSEVANVRRETNRMPGNYSASWMRMLCPVCGTMENADGAKRAKSAVNSGRTAGPHAAKNEGSENNA
jgi:GTPase SAR1 family protein